MTAPALRVRALSKSFGQRTAVDGIDLTVQPGQIVGLLGPNGAGKTTTLNMICGLLPPGSGSVDICGLPAGRSREARALLGLVPQEVALHVQLTAEENLRYFGALMGLHGRAVRERLEHCLGTVGLSDRRSEPVHAFSGGMQRRLNLAVALMNSPQLLVLDEPTVGVDPQSRNSILAHLRVLADDGCAVLLATHHLNEVERICDEVYIVDAGQVVVQGSPAALISQHAGEGLLELTVDPVEAVHDLVAVLAAIPGVRATAEDEVLVLRGADLPDRLPEILAAVSAPDRQVVRVRMQDGDLENVFLNVTGRSLRDA